jgi:hypothetical protein
MAYLHALDPTDDEVEEDLDSNSCPISNSESPDTCLINAAKSVGKPLPPGDVCRIMSKSSTRHVNFAHIEYQVSLPDYLTTKSRLSLINHSENGGVSGKDVRITFQNNCTVNIEGIDNHHDIDIGIGTVGGVVQTHRGPLIDIMHQYTLLAKNSSIHSPCQLAWFKNDVNDKSIHVPGGLQCIIT